MGREKWHGMEHKFNRMGQDSSEQDRMGWDMVKLDGIYIYGTVQSRTEWDGTG